MKRRLYFLLPDSDHTRFAVNDLKAFGIHTKELTLMSSPTPTHPAPNIRFEELNWVAAPPLPRDQEQSHRLHEPHHLINSIDPITGNDIGDVTGHPSLVDGNLTIYFESNETRAEYENTPINHPYEHLTGDPSADIDRGG